jgi:hypothetical protein
LKNKIIFKEFFIEKIFGFEKKKNKIKKDPFQKKKKISTEILKNNLVSKNAFKYNFLFSFSKKFRFHDRTGIMIM